MLIRKNTKEHSAIVEVLGKYAQDKDRKKFIKLYIIEAGKTLEDRIPVEKTGSFADVYYNLTFDSVLKNIVDEDHKFHKSDEDENLYYFESNFTPAETPFEFAPPLQKEVEALLKDKKFKVRKKTEVVSTDVEADEDDGKIRTLVPPEVDKKNKKEKEKPKDEPRTDYKLRFPINFADLGKIVLEEPSLTKKDLLDYYNLGAPFILPFIENKPLLDRDIDEVLKDTGKETPDWAKTANIYIENIAGEFLLAQNKEHLLFLIDAGVIELTSWLSRNKNFHNPDFLIISLIPSPNQFEVAVEVAKICKEILDICELPGFLKTTGEENLELYIPLNGKNDFKTSKKLADLLVKLITKKEPKLTSVNGQQKGKVFLDTSTNAVGKNVIVPYSFREGTEGLIATPVDWSELLDSFSYFNYTFRTILEKIQAGEFSVSSFLENPIDAKEKLELLDRRYGFLLG